MNEKELVRALALMNPNIHIVLDEGTDEAEDWHQCFFCNEAVPISVDDHKVDCLWRKAVEFGILSGN